MNRREVRNQLGFYLRSQGEVIVRNYKVYRLFSEALGDLGTQPGLHNTRRIQDTPLTRIFNLPKVNRSHL